MIEGGETLPADDARRLAELHHATMPSSVLGRMGPKTLARYYRWAAVSAWELVFIAREDGAPIGAAVLSYQPETVIRRFILNRPVSFAGGAAAAYIRNRAFRRDVHAMLKGEGRLSDEEAPQVLQIFVARDRQARHIGRGLLQKVEDSLRRRQSRRYYIRTLQERNEATLAFYQRRGFQTVTTRTFCGQHFLVLEKTVE